MAAKARIEAALERALFNNATFRAAAFSLAHNFGWKTNKKGNTSDGTGTSFVIRIIEPAMEIGPVPKFQEGEQ